VELHLAGCYDIMAHGADRSRSKRGALAYIDSSDSALALAAPTPPVDREKVLPLPGWLVKVYFIFPIVLYIPDALFNYYVYSRGVEFQDANFAFQAAQIALWGFLSIGVVGMAYLLSVLAPWHWGQGHKIQAFFCALGVIIATAITTWNSLAYRSQNTLDYNTFQTDKWAYQLFPGLQANHISITMVLVAIAPPFWGLFWAVVQPTQSGRSLAQLQESHAERLMRMQQDAELKRLRADTNAKIREAQLRGMAQTAAAARQQASGLFGKKNQQADGGASTETQAESKAPGQAAPDTRTTPAADVAPGDESAGILQLPQVHGAPGREMVGGRTSMMNNIAPVQAAVHLAPAKGAHSGAAQPALLSDADVRDAAGMPASDAISQGSRRPPTLGGFGDMDDADAMTGTSGPRHAIRPPTQISSLMRGLGELRPAYAQAVQEAMRELNPNGTKKSVPARELNALVARKLNIDESMARQIISRYREQQRAAQR
jgi:hypothetical protein